MAAMGSLPVYTGTNKAGGCDRRKHIGYVRPSVASQSKGLPANDVIAMSAVT